ncbi:MAG TPA: ABC transporter permease [Vicinamibacterales bacterium]|nr:ABC transporter permease [Vicinamibacterales bacterium]
MSRLTLDLKASIRTLIRSRLMASLAILAIALGIGITTAVFSIFNGVLLAPLPYPHPEQLVMVYDTQPSCSTCPASFPKYNDWKTRNQVFSAIGGATELSITMTGHGDPVRLRGFLATASYADVFGVRPEIGRWFTEDEDRFGGPKVAVLGHDLWTEQFGSDRAIVGQTVVLNDQRYEIIGVMSAVNPPQYSRTAAQIFAPLQRKLDPSTRGNHFLMTTARLKPGMTLERAAAEMRALGQTLAREFGNNHGIDVRSYTEALVGDVRASLEVLLGAVLLLLLIACANVANLLLTSGLARRHDLAIRLALGADKRDLARQLGMESLLLALIGGAVGVLLAFWILNTFLVLAAHQLPRATSVAIDGRVLLFSALASALVGVICGVWPLFVIKTSELVASVREGDSRSSTGAGRTFGNGLVVGEVALAFALLVGSGLLMKNLILLRHRDAGIRIDRIVSFQVTPTGVRYRDPDQQVAFYRELYTRLAQVGTIERAGLTSHLPMFQFGYNGEFQIEGVSPWGPNEAPLVEYRWFYGNYLETMGIRLLEGRLLDARDGRDAPAVLINHSMADKFWPGQNPIGKRFGQGTDRDKWYEVVGVLSDVRSGGLARRTLFEFYRTIDEAPFTSMTVVIRTRDANSLAIVPTARQIIASIDPSLPLTDVQTMEHVVGESIGRPRLMSALTVLFGGLAGLLAMLGVYGVMAYHVSKQRREFGLRMALGADSSQVRNLVVGRGLALAGAGVAIGTVIAWLMTGVLKTLLDDVQATDPVVFVATGAGVVIVALLATYLPARAAGRVDPIVVLRDA